MFRELAHTKKGGVKEKKFVCIRTSIQFMLLFFFARACRNACMFVDPLSYERECSCDCADRRGSALVYEALRALSY